MPIIQDLNLGSSTNVVNFVNVVNLKSDPKYAAAGSGAHCKDPHWGAGVKTLEVNACNGFKLSKNLYFDTFFHIVNQLLLTINCLRCLQSSC